MMLTIPYLKIKEMNVMFLLHAKNYNDNNIGY